MDLSDRTVLVIGGAGYVGSVLVPVLLQAGAQVRVLDQLIYDNGFALVPLLDDPRLQFHRGDLRDDRDLAQAAHGATDVVLLAALVGDPICKSYPELARSVNEDGAKKVVDRLGQVGISRLVFTSTCSNYGIHESSLAVEESALNPQSLYARSKIAMEDYLLGRAGRPATTTVLRIATAYGLSPRMRFDLTVSQFARELAMGRPLQVYDADTWRPYCHVKDIAKAIVAVLTAAEADVRGEVFNVGDNSQQFTKRMIVDEVCKHLAECRSPTVWETWTRGTTACRSRRSLAGWTSGATTPCRATCRGCPRRASRRFSGRERSPELGNYTVRNIEPTY